MSIEHRLQKITQKKLRTYDKIESSFEKELDGVVDDITAGISGYLRHYHKGGQLTETQIINAQLNLAMKEDLLRIFDEQGYTRLAQRLVEEYDVSIDFLDEIFSELDIPLVFTGTDIDVINVLKLVDYQEFLRIADQSANAVHMAITRGAIGKMTFNEIRAEIENALAGTMKRYSRTLTNTGLMIYDATVSALKYEEAGIKRYRYAGPLDKVTRPFCRWVLERQKKVKSFTRKEIDAMAGKYDQPGNPFILRGGFNCRHSWIPAMVTND